jgi:alpha-amylase/alpha-mannosidase (GH57 family)
VARLIVHGHFYQPPRENPWTDEIPHQKSAAPFHDWNERVHAECYRPSAFADIVTSEGEAIVNNYERISFNVGPTLMQWLQKEHPATYARIVDADRASARRLGHGNAIAQAFHHSILPLAHPRDARTEIRWGIADFRHRFGRDPEGIWLPETAINDTVAQILIEEGVGFTIVAPHQIAAWRDQGRWIGTAEAAIDTRLPHRYPHPDGSGRFLTLFVYDSGIAHAIAFANATASAEAFIDMFTAGSDSHDQVIHAATDGETYGHHQKFGDVGLAYALFNEAEKRTVEVTNYAAFLTEHPPRGEVQLVPGEGTSWSCSHGVGRWKADCGCSTRAELGWNQRWRAPLREALEVVRDAADEVYERLGTRLLADPWAARDRYVDVVVRATPLPEFLQREAGGRLTDSDIGTASKLLELGRSALAMFTSCGWFFADLADIETMQIMRYAARTLELMRELDEPTPETDFLATLAKARSNDPDRGDGAEIFKSASAS